MEQQTLLSVASEHQKSPAAAVTHAHFGAVAYSEPSKLKTISQVNPRPSNERHTLNVNSTRKSSEPLKRRAPTRQQLKELRANTSPYITTHSSMAACEDASCAKSSPLQYENGFHAHSVTAARAWDYFDRMGAKRHTAHELNASSIAAAHAAHHDKDASVRAAQRAKAHSSARTASNENVLSPSVAQAIKSISVDASDAAIASAATYAQALRSLGFLNKLSVSINCAKAEASNAAAFPRIKRQDRVVPQQRRAQDAQASSTYLCRDSGGCAKAAKASAARACGAVKRERVANLALKLHELSQSKHLHELSASDAKALKDLVYLLKYSRLSAEF